MDLTGSQHAWFDRGARKVATAFSSLRRYIQPSVTRFTSDISPKPVERGGAQKLNLVVDSVWEWVATCIHNSPVQPVVNLGLGLGQENPPQFLIDAYKEALNHVSCNQYGPTDGLPYFRETLAGVYSRVYGKNIDPGTQISIHTGATEAILSAINAFVEPGDEVIIMEPAFDLYELHTRSVGGIVKPVRLHPPSNAATNVTNADDWSLDFDELEASISPKTKVLVLNTPHNPLGKIFSKDELLSIGQLCVKYGLIIVSDEVYEHLDYTSTFTRIATLNDQIARHTVTIGSIGKAFNATGWRVGYAIGDSNLITQMKRAHIILSYTTAGPPQMAAAAGLQQAAQNGFWDENREMMRAKIRILCEAFDYLGLTYVRPSGAHYILVNASRFRIPPDYVFPKSIEGRSRDWKYCYFLIQEAGVATIPVSASFCNANAHVAQDYLRFVACKTVGELELARSRLMGMQRFLPKASSGEE